MHWQPVDVADLLEDVATSFSGSATSAGVTLSVELDPAAAGLSITAIPAVWIR